jgi:hypothetical protein
MARVQLLPVHPITDFHVEPFAERHSCQGHGDGYDVTSDGFSTRGVQKRVAS